MRGRVEWAGRHGVAGWARNGTSRVLIVVRSHGRVVGQTLADSYRPDLAAAGEGDGRCAFELWFDPPLGDDAEILVHASQGVEIAGSPCRIAPLPPCPAERPNGSLPWALVVDEGVPDATRDAGSAALLSHMQALRHLGYAVVFATLADAPAEIARAAGRIRLAYLHRLRPMLDFHALVRASNPGVRVMFSLADLASLRATRQAAALGGAVPAGLIAAERAALAAADAVITHSHAEAAMLRGSAVFIVPWTVVPAPVTTPFRARRGVGFIGNFGHAPNLDATRMLLDEIMPMLWRLDPAMPCLIAGHGMPVWLRAQAGGPVTMVESLTEARALFERVRVTVAPLRFGAGVKGKVLDSMAAGVPCVCSAVAAEGIDLPRALRSDGPAELAATLWRLHQSESENRALAADCLELIARHHGMARVCTMLHHAITAIPPLPR